MAFPIPRLPPVISAILSSKTPTMLAPIFLSLLTPWSLTLKAFGTYLTSDDAAIPASDGRDSFKEGCQKASFNVALAQRRDTVALGLEQRQ
jgi:hypothetical protein